MSIYQVQGQDYELFGAGITAVATSITLTSCTIPTTNIPVTMAMFGDIGYATLEPETSREENISFTGIVQNINGTATLTGVTRGINLYQIAEVFPADINNQRSHIGGSILRFTNSAPYYELFGNKFREQTISGLWKFPGSTSLGRPQAQNVIPALLADEFITKGEVISLVTSPVITPSVVSSSSATTGTSTSISLTWNHTHSGVNGLLLVQVSTQEDETITGIDYNGDAMTQEVSQTRVTGNLRTEIWSLVNPDLGTNAITITMSGVAFISATALSFNEVNQTTPIGVIDSADGSSASPSVSSLLTTQVSSVLVDALGTANDPMSFTAGANQSLQQQVASGSTRQIATSIKAAPTIATYSMDYTIAPSTDWAMCGVEVIGIIGGFATSLEVQENGVTVVTGVNNINILSNSPIVTNPSTGQVNIDLTNIGGGSGTGEIKPMTFAINSIDNGIGQVTTGYSDREALLVHTVFSTPIISIADKQGFIQSRNVTLDWADAGFARSMVLIGQYLYVAIQKSSSPYENRIYRYDASNLSLGGTQMTISGLTLSTVSSDLRITSNGTNIFVNYDTNQSGAAYEIAKLSISGTTLTYVSGVSCGSTVGQFDTSFAVDKSENIYGIDAGIIYIYDNTGTLIETTGNMGAGSMSILFNWDNTIYGSNPNSRVFVKLYLPNTDLSSGGGNENTIYATAAEDLTAGEVVGMSNTLTDTVGRYFVEGGNSATLPVNADDISYANIGNNKVVLAYVQESTTNLYVAVLEIDPTDYTVATVGTPVLVTSTNNAASLHQVAQLDTDKFAVLYAQDPNDQDSVIVAGTVSGTTITLGTPQNVLTTGLAQVGAQTIEELGTDKVVVAVEDTGTVTKVIAITFSGTVATIGTPVSLTAGNSLGMLTNGAKPITKIDTDKFVITVGTSSVFSAVACTVSGTTITAGSLTTLDNTVSSVSSKSYAVSHTTDAFVVSYNKNINDESIVVATVSGTTITAGTPLAYSATNINPIWVESATSILLFNSQVLTRYSISGTNISFSKIAAQLYPASGIGDVINMGGYFFFGAKDSNLTALRISIQGMANNTLGIVQNTVAKGGTAVVLVTGISNAHTGLVPGMYYQAASAGLLTTVSSTGTTDSPVEKAYLAVSSTKLKI